MGNDGALFPSPDGCWIGKNVLETLQGIPSQQIFLIVYTLKEEKPNFAQELNYEEDLLFSDVKPDSRAFGGGGGGLYYIILFLLQREKELSR